MYELWKPSRPTALPRRTCFERAETVARDHLNPRCWKDHGLATARLILEEVCAEAPEQWRWWPLDDHRQAATVMMLACPAALIPIHGGTWGDTYNALSLSALFAHQFLVET